MLIFSGSRRLHELLQQAHHNLALLIWRLLFENFLDRVYYVRAEEVEVW